MHSITAYNPLAPEVKESPYPFYEWLRQERPVYYNQEHDFWALSRYQDIVWAARTPEIFSSAQGVGPDKRSGLSMISHDPPVHTRLRKLVVRAFTPRKSHPMRRAFRPSSTPCLTRSLPRGRLSSLPTWPFRSR